MSTTSIDETWLDWLAEEAGAKVEATTAVKTGVVGVVCFAVVVVQRPDLSGQLRWHVDDTFAGSDEFPRASNTPGPVAPSTAHSRGVNWSRPVQKVAVRRPGQRREAVSWEL